MKQQNKSPENTKDGVISGIKQALKTRAFKDRQLHVAGGSLFQKFCDFAVDHVNDTLFPVGLHLGLELALYEFVQISEINSKHNQDTLGSLRRYFLDIAWLFGDDFFLEYKKVYDGVNKSLGVASVLENVMMGHTRTAQTIVESITRVETTVEHSGKIGQSELEKGHVVTIETSDGRAKGVIVQVLAGGNMFMIKTDSSKDLICKYRLECNHISSQREQRHSTTEINPVKKAMSSIAYFDQGKKYFGANIALQIPNSTTKQQFMLLLQEYDIETRTQIQKISNGARSDYLAVRVNPEDIDMIRDCIAIAEDLGCEMTGLDEIDNPIPLFRDFTGKGLGQSKYNAMDIETGVALLQNNKLNRFCYRVRRICETYNFSTAMEYIRQVDDQLTAMSITYDFSRVIAHSDLKEHIRGERGNIVLLVSIIKDLKINIHTIDYLTKELQSPYDRNSYSARSMMQHMGSYYPHGGSSNSYLNGFDVNSLKQCLEDITQYYKSVGLPITASTQQCGYERIFQFYMQQLGFKIKHSTDPEFEINETKLLALLAEFKKYGLDENGEYSGQNRSRREILELVKQHT